MIEPDTLLLFQTGGLILFFASMALRMRGNNLVHGIMMIALVAIGWSSVAMSLPSFMDSSFMQPYMNPSSTFGAFSLHSILGIGALVFGTWLVALWRPRSTDFAAKSKKIWQATTGLWVSTYVVGVLLFFALGATFFA